MVQEVDRVKDGFRHEYKFLISRSSADLLKLRLPCVMKRDDHAGPTGEYTIRSLYFDDWNGSALAEKLDGVRDRSKYRIRIYNDDDSVIKLEKKEKHGSLTKKTAQTISRADVLALEQALPEGCPDHRDGLVEELRLACLGKGLRPKVLVDYDRTPFVCVFGNTRITLDDHLRTRPYDCHLFSSSQAMIPVLDRDQVILEVKFDDYLPGYLADVLRDIPKDALAISKFALCMNLR